MILDSYIVKAVSNITSRQVFDSFVKLYPDVDVLDEALFISEIDKWFAKLRKIPGRSLSTGRRKSLRGVFTCGLLDVLEVNLPRSKRNRNELAWAIINSKVGRNLIGHAPELDEERERLTKIYGDFFN